MYWESGRGLEPWEGVTTLLEAGGFAFSLSAGVSRFPIFLACDSLISLVIDCRGIGCVLFVDTIILDVLVLV